MVKETEKSRRETDRPDRPAGAESKTGWERPGGQALTLPPARIVIAGTGSGCGKTTVTSGLLQCLKNRGIRTAAFKCGPDYIDPMFHEAVLGVKSGNLDLFFSDEETLRWLAASGAESCEIAVAEGVMGYYDGIGMTEEASSWQVARALQAPAVLVIGTRGMAASVTAVLEGFLHHREESRIRGVIFNRLPQKLYGRLAAQAEKIGVVPLGYLPEERGFSLESRHLGLVTAEEIADLKERMKLLAGTMEETVDIEGILRLAKEAEIHDISAPERILRLARSATEKKKPCIAVAEDEAFCFTYRDNIRVLRLAGAEIISFSPLRDERLPERADGILLGGGYPELYAERLSENRTMRKSVHDAVQSGIPVIAECGGFLYLHERMEGAEGGMYEMAGVIPGECRRGSRLGRFGYILLTAQSDGMIARKGEVRKAHEFHYWKSDSEGSDFTVRKADGSSTGSCGISSEAMYAGFPHLSFCADPESAERFVKKCRQHRDDIRMRKNSDMR